MFTKAMVAVAGLVAASVAGSAEAAFVVTLENPGVQNSTSKFSAIGVETFDNATVTGWNATTNFATTFGGSGFSGNYSGVSTSRADVYGGAGGTGSYALARDNGSAASFSLTNLAAAGAGPVNYFGLWVSAVDSGNSLSFYKSGTLLYSFNAATLTNYLASASNGSAYYGNPSSGYAGQNSPQSYAFLNFYDTTGTFDSVVFNETALNSGFESDNHTVGSYTAMSGTTIAAVPEPASWAMMIGGFGLIGGLQRRTKRRLAVA